MSNIFDIKLLKEDYEYSKNVHHRYRKKEFTINPNAIGIYYLYNDKKEIIYIGKAENSIRQRLIQHLFSKPSIYLTEKEIDKLQTKRDKVKYFSFEEVNKENICLTEILLIQKYRPILNVQFKF